MSLLRSAESMLGPLGWWPSNIPNYLFFDPPTFRTVLRLINFYGNRVPCSWAVELFHTCNDDTSALVTADFYYFFDQYRRDTDTIHMGIYFDVRLEKFLFINGSN